MAEEKAANLKIISDSDFMALSSVDVEKYVNFKGKFKYLSWSDAHQIMKSYDPLAKVTEQWFDHYRLIASPDNTFYQMVTDREPYQKTDNSSFVVVTVTFKNREETEIYPISDYKNQDIANPTMAQVNKALKRGFVKALAKHGLGLYIYRNEDLPVIPIISIKELEKLEALLKSLNDFVGQDTTQVLIDRTNKQIEHDFVEMGLEKITAIESLNKDQYGLFLRTINEAKNRAEAEKKKEKKKE